MQILLTSKNKGNEVNKRRIVTLVIRIFKTPEYRLKATVNKLNYRPCRIIIVRVKLREGVKERILQAFIFSD